MVPKQSPNFSAILPLYQSVDDLRYLLRLMSSLKQEHPSITTVSSLWGSEGQYQSAKKHDTSADITAFWNVANMGWDVH